MLNSSITYAKKKKAFFIVFNIALFTIIIIGLVVAVSKFNDPERVSSSIDNSKEKATEDQSSIIKLGGIDTSDGKDLLIWLIGGSSNNFGKRDLVKGETITWTVACEQERELKIGIMSVSTKKIYSEIVNDGTGTVTFTIPEDGDYRIYVENNSLDDAHFHLILDEKLEGAIV
ncbi:hypothetical protein BVG16_30745 [Paenibacillus selenitireducens]|uniref:GOLD domain-containing protein n=1 Tax=Paenibacillus selenitireducens TaxID=1324314 RepID=A0A1T2WZJ1_9BACL|nr:hypothetical protein [Paenibacillus selenitireducens]OPA73049.1 hypothetical protein BVG16_30745 [Paenibacillus selenitireducens]